MTNRSSVIYKLQVIAILLMAAGQGWAGGNFTPADSPFWNPALHFIPILVLIIFSMRFFRISDTYQGVIAGAGWSNIAINIFAVITIIGCIFLVVAGASSTDPGGVGVKSIEDWFPTVILNIGTILWLVMQIPARRETAALRTLGVSKEQKKGMINSATSRVSNDLGVR